MASPVGALGIAAIMFVSSTIESVIDRPGGALMACLLLIIAVTLIGGPWIGYGVGVASIGATAYYLARPVALVLGRHDGRAHPVRGLPGPRRSSSSTLVARLAVARGEAEGRAGGPTACST